MSRVIKNSVLLTIAHFSGYLIPILELPILARALGPESYGNILFFMSISLAMSIFVEYGFNLSGARDVSRSREDCEKISIIIGSIILSKAIISILIVCIAIVFIIIFDTRFTENRDLVLPSLLYFFAFGFSPFWFFQGTERMIWPTVINLSLRFLALGLLYVFINEPSDEVLALYILSSGGLLTTIITTIWMLIEVKKIIFCWRHAKNQIAKGWHSFVYRSSNDIMMSVSPAIIGFASTTYQVGIFIPAEKLTKAAAGMAMPILTAFFPHLSRKVNVTKEGLWLVMFLTSGAILGSFLLWLLAPWLIINLVGSEFESSIKLMSFFVWIIPIRVCNQSLGLAVLIPSGRERYAGFSIMACASLAVILGFILTTIYGAKGMIFGLMFSEVILLFLLLLGVIKLNE